MNLDEINIIVQDISKNHEDKDVLYIKNNSGDPELVFDRPADDADLIGTVYHIDCLAPNSVQLYRKNEERFVAGKPIVVLCRGTGMYDFSVPEEYKANPPYTGRPFIHRTWDCFTLLKDYFSREFGIEMPPVSYYDEWWKKGDDFYMELSGVAGFYPVTKLQKYDVIAMRLNSYVFNHSAIYLGDNKILHHVGGKFSCIEPIRPAYMKSIFGYFRHKDLPQQNG